MVKACECTLLVLCLVVEGSFQVASSTVDDEVSLLQVGVHQDSSLAPSTQKDPGSDDRYPPIFIDLKRLLTDGETQGSGSASSKSNQSISKSSLKILSYGCGDGAETRTLRKYFPTALVDGVDDAGTITQNTANNTDSLLRYFQTGSKLAHGTYDAVLAMSALGSQAATSHLPYSKFADTMEFLDSLLRPGGFLVMYNSNYPFDEFEGAKRYKSAAEGCNIANENVVDKLDQKGSTSPHSWNRGWCSNFGVYCTESGWKPKYDRSGRQVQPQQPDDSMSFGCIFPGTIFKKKVDAQKPEKPATLNRPVSPPIKVAKAAGKNSAASEAAGTLIMGESKAAQPAHAPNEPMFYNKDGEGPTVLYSQRQ